MNVSLMSVLFFLFRKVNKCMLTSCVNYCERPVRHIVAELYVQKSINVIP